MSIWNKILILNTKYERSPEKTKKKKKKVKQLKIGNSIRYIDSPFRKSKLLSLNCIITDNIIHIINTFVEYTPFTQNKTSSAIEFNSVASVKGNRTWKKKKN